MYARVIGGLAAWSFGAVLATALSLFAISAVGEGIFADPVRTLTGDDVARALAAASASPSPSASGAAPLPASASPQGTPVSRRPAAAPSPASPAVTLGRTASRSSAVGSPGGTALAVCTPAGAYLTSWSPAQGYAAQDVSRGPSAVVSVTFTAPNSTVRLRVSCASGTPAPQVSGGSEDNRSPDQFDH